MKKSENEQLNSLQLFVSMGLMVLSMGLILGLVISTTLQRWTNPELFKAKQAATLELRIAGAITYQIVNILSVVAAFLGLVYAGYIGLQWLNRLAHRTYAKDGLYPLIEISRGIYHDPNRDNLGAHPLITYEALQVQKQGALQADKLSVNIKSDKAMVEALTPDNSRPPLPDLLPAQHVTSTPTLDALTIGQTEKGLVQESIHNLMHILAVGASGFGKSAFLRYLLWQLAQVQEEFSVVGIDAYGSELNALAGWRRLKYAIAKNTNDAGILLNEVSNEIARRKELYNQYPRAYNLPSYNQLAHENLGPVIIVVDEGTAMLADKTIGSPLAQVVQTARQYGAYVLLAGQSAKSSVIDTATRDNFSTRLCFHTSPTSRRVVLGETVANISQKGRAWVQLPGRDLDLLQVPYVSRDELIQVIETGHVSPLPASEEEDMQLIEDDPELPEADRVRFLHEQGLSLRQIQKRVYGYVGGSAFDAVKDILDSD